jgi:hypothetical protein
MEDPGSWDPRYFQLDYKINVPQANYCNTKFSPTLIGVFSVITYLLVESEKYRLKFSISRQIPIFLEEFIKYTLK